MKFCCASEPFTPAAPVFMHGFGARQHKSVGVHDELYVKAAMLEANKTVLLLTIDALGADRGFVEGVKEALRNAFGLERDEVLINFSHTHHSVFLTGPDPKLRRGGYSIAQERWTDNEDELDYGADEALYAAVTETILRLVAHCRDHLIEGELSVGRAASDFAVSRRKPDGAGGVVWSPYYEGDIDKELLVLKLADGSGTVKGILYSYGCHTTSMGPDNMLLSNDFAGRTSRVLEDAYPGATALFLQGCAGELKPMRSADGNRFRSLSIAEMEQAGDDLAADVIAVLERGELKRVDCSFRTAIADPLLYTERTEAEHYERIATDPAANSFYRSAAVRTMRAIRDGTVKDRLPHCICVWHLDDRTRLVAMEGEVSTQYSLLIKRLFAPHTTLTLGYTNGVYCYVPTRRMIGEGGYEAECNFFFNLRGPFVPEIEDIIVGQIVQTDMRLRWA
ncbi:neutral/alkaline non-lysosomal ceramidase N-terminal domain-containing protein [Paenibacillus sp. GYB003]|uniref:neutral/alkaline non-lysosomal ceramidase N-terminal domain-containing protein n=1 Tax=Paenibacillus sp. GYB003 TaxID=2994392 RepID=UPI002F962386